MEFLIVLFFIVCVIFIWLCGDDITNLISFRLFKQVYNLYMKLGILEQYTYVFLNIESFKYINELKGNKYGDLLLKSIGFQVKNNLRFFEIASRIVNDNFVLLLKSNIDIEGRIKEIIKDIETGNENLKIRVGYFVIKENETDWVTSNSFAKFACISETNRNNKLVDYDSTYFLNLCNQEKLYFDYKQGLKDKDFKIYYQGKFDINGKLKGAEALVRWQHKELGLLSPFLFIPMLEDKNDICDLDCYVVECVCEHLLELQKEMDLKDFKIAINLSYQSFKNKDIIYQIFKIVRDYNINPKNIEFELTEGKFIDVDKDTIFMIIQEMHVYGFTIALDDFGTGYSSLKVLNNLPIDVLKIDKCFIDGMEKSSHIVVSLIQMAHKLGLKTVAEGVEEESQLNFLKKEHCDLIQGYLFARPIPWVEFQKCLV